MKYQQLTLLILITLFLSACEFKCQVGNMDKKEETSTNPASQKAVTPKTLNGIELNAKDVQVSRAFLSLDNGELVPSDNTVSLGEKISLVINIDNGWKETAGKCFIGASEKITTDNGTELLSTGDMFSSYNETGLDATDAKVITLKARITSAPPGPVEYYMVNFRVWDKKGNGEITGKYKFHVRL